MKLTELFAMTSSCEIVYANPVPIVIVPEVSPMRKDETEVDLYLSPCGPVEPVGP